MAGMHALHKILAKCARPLRETVTPGESADGRNRRLAETLARFLARARHTHVRRRRRRFAPRDTLEIDTETFLVRNIGSGNTLRGVPLPEIYRGMIEAGGEKPYLKARLAAERARA